MKKRVIAIILAAGKSVRFGGQKLLYEFRGHPLILTTLKPFLRFPSIDEVLVVVGYRKDEMIQVLKDYPVRIVVNENYERGLSSSILSALPYVEEDDEVFIHLGDKPFVSVELLHTLLGNVKKEAHIIVPTYDGTIGHPILVGPGSYLKGLSEIDGDEGLRSVISKRPESLVLTPYDVSVIIDIDTTEDLQKFERMGFELEKSQS